MRSDKPKTGFTLVELLTVVSVILVLAVIGLPAVRQVLDSFESSGGVKNVIRLAIARGRSIAARERRFAGVRFQQDVHGNQYMVFIVHDTPNTGLVNGFREAGGLDPVRLPDDIGVMDLRLVDRTFVGAGVETMDDPIDGDDRIDDPCELAETTTFSIVFSPTGKLVVRQVQVRNRDGIPDSNGEINNPSDDRIFNKKDAVDDGDAMFYQDDYGFTAWWSHYPDLAGPGPELSRNNFIIYDKRELDSVSEDSRWTDYLQDLEVMYINPYTGQIINE